MVKEDITGRPVEIGDYIAYPNQGSLEVAKVLNLRHAKYQSLSFKLSCQMSMIGSKYVYKQKGTGIDALRHHNSYFYKIFYSDSFIILDLKSDPVDERLLKSRTQLIKDEKSK